MQLSCVMTDMLEFPMLVASLELFLIQYRSPN